MPQRVKDRQLIPGRLFRDLDGSLVHLIKVDRNLCSCIALTDADENRQVTHADNFRRRFRSFDDTEFENRKAA